MLRDFSFFVCNNFSSFFRRGGGIEAAISGPWTAKLEFLYVDLGEATCGAADCGVSTSTSFHTNIVRVGLNYRF